MAVDVSTPIAIAPQFAEMIDMAVDEFVKGAEGWESVHWYHDEPIWFIERRDGNLIRHVQISAFRTRSTGGSPTVVLKLIPDLYRVEDGRAVEHIDAAAIRDQVKSIRLTGTSLDNFEKELRDRLGEAWAATQKLYLPGT